ncbi:YveK family protein [Acidipropionibacterium acidipropionici]|uniref:hypothetical protein n=1 Tax=Acidipropionibacterium acidipropionici TaxID=1748 RepID=UPI000A9C68FB|nr:hypothetical protein [Acidipropionibacterium acidipropionici]
MSNPTESHSLAEHEPAEHRAAEPIDLLGYLKRMGHYWIAGLVAAVIVAGALLGFGATRGSDPVGSTWAKAHVMVTLPEPRTTALGAASADAGTRVLSSYVAVSDSDLLINDAVKRLGDGTKPATLKAATSLYSGAAPRSWRSTRWVPMRPRPRNGRTPTPRPWWPTAPHCCRRRCRGWGLRHSQSSRRRRRPRPALIRPCPRAPAALPRC